MEEVRILIEGPDATGKTTLAKHIAERMGYTIVESEGPPRYLGDIAERIARYAEMDNVIFVRHPVVSHPIYDQGRRAQGKPQAESVLPQAKFDFYDSNPVIIYCHPHRPHEHDVKEYDTPEHLAMLKEQRDLIDALYKQWALHRAHIIYRIGDNVERICSFINCFDPVRDVASFHTHHQINYDGPPRALPPDLVKFRLAFMREEITEYTAHMTEALSELDKLTRAPVFATGEFAFDNANLVHHLAEALDALCDQVYVALGTAHLHGFDFRAAWARVHIANMFKQRGDGPAVTEEERMKLKMIKPPGWEPPRHEDLVEDHAHRGHRP